MLLTLFFLQDGLLRVILNGGPLRVFYPGDAKLLEEDLEILKVSGCEYKFIPDIFARDF